MTITTNDDRDELTATGGQTVFTYTFKIYASTDLNVYQTPAGQDFDDVSDLITSYTVDPSSIGDTSGGFITLDAGATNNDRITIVSDIPSSRTIDYQVNGDFDAGTVNEDLDRAISLLKQSEGISRRSLLFAQSAQGVASKTLESPTDSAFLKWKSDLSGIENHTFSADTLTTNVNITDGVATYAQLKAIDTSSVSDGNIIPVTNDGIAGNFVVKTGTVADDGRELIVFTDDPNRYARRSSATHFSVAKVDILEWITPSLHTKIAKDTLSGGDFTTLTTDVQAALDYYEGRATETVRQGRDLYFPAGVYKFDGTLVVGGYCSIVGEAETTTVLSWANAPSGTNCISLLDNSPSQPFSGLYTFGTKLKSFELFCQNESANAITTLGVHQGCGIYDLKIRNVNNRAMTISGAGGSAHFNIENTEIVGGTTAPTATRIGIYSDMNSTVLIRKLSVNGANASHRFEQALFIADGGHIVDNIVGEYCEDVIFLWSGATTGYVQTIRNVTGNSTNIGGTIHVDTGFPGSVIASGIVGPISSGDVNARCIRNDNDSTTDVGRDFTCAHWQWGVTSASLTGAQYHTVDSVRFTDANPTGTEKTAFLAEYSHGSWTPTISIGIDTIGYATQKGTYTRVGKQVTANFDITTNAGTGNASRLTVAGLPFAAQASSSTDAQGNGIVGFTTAFNATNPIIVVSEGSSTCTFYKANGVNFAGSDITTPAATTLKGTIFYNTDD